MEIRSIARGAAWVAGGLLLVGVGLYVALLVVNWRDEPKSQDVLRFEALAGSRPAVADQDNAYVDALGIGAPPDQDPIALGLQRKAWLQRASLAASGAGAVILPGRDVDYRGARSTGVSALAEACSQAGLACVNALQDTPAQLDEWLAAEGWLRDRYRQMLGRRHWLEVIPEDSQSQLPTYQHTLEGQKLHLLDTWRHASAGDAALVRAQLEQDLVFWRTVLASSDMLITKMIAAAAINRHFAYGNLALRALSPQQAAAAVPASWMRPLTAAERSMVRALAGEWRFGDSALRMVASHPELMQVKAGVPIVERAALPLFLPQASSNRYAARLAQLAAVSEVDYPKLEAALIKHETYWHGEISLFRFYNPMGNVLESIASGASFKGYIARVNDLEGLRRAAIAANELRARGLSGENAAGALDGSPLRDPYHQKPFAWDSTERTVVFTGLENAPRGRHALLL